MQHLHGFSGILQADAYSGYNPLYDSARAAGAITPALCWAHARRQFFELADIAANARRGRNAAAISPVALEAVRRIDALFAIERGNQRPKRRRPAAGAPRTLEYPFAGSRMLRGLLALQGCKSRRHVKTLCGGWG